jgi:hypothetical protein
LKDSFFQVFALRAKTWKKKKENTALDHAAPLR